MIKYIQNCSFVRYMKWDYFKAPEWLRKFYDFSAKWINLFLNWYYKSELPELKAICVKNKNYIGICMGTSEEIYFEDNEYYIDFLWMPKPFDWEERRKITEDNTVWVEWICE